MPDASVLLTNLFLFALFMRYLYYVADEKEERGFIQGVDYICAALTNTVTNAVANTLVISYNAYKFIEKLGKTRTILNDSDEEEEDEDETKNKNKKETKIKYEDKYLTKYHELEDIECSKEQLDNLKNSILMENTPQGNLIMFYDNSRESFIFYSDNTIPYRYLETAGRKYVIMNNCKRIFVDMAQEIDNVKQKQDQQKLDQQKQDRQKLELEEPTSSSTKKNVFAKLKNYNNTPTNPRNSTNPASQSTKKSDLLIVKEHANRYSYEGKMANFSFLKKVDRKVVDKKYALSFAEFRAMQNAANLKN